MNASILLIDVDSSSVMWLSNLLSRQGFHVHIAEDGAAGVSLAERLNPALILLAVELPGTTGYSLCKQFRKHRTLSETPLVLLSSSATPRDFELHQRLRVRADAYLLKPFSAQSLFEAIGPLVSVKLSFPQLDNIGRRLNAEPPTLSTELLPIAPLHRVSVPELSSVEQPVVASSSTVASQSPPPPELFTSTEEFSLSSNTLKRTEISIDEDLELSAFSAQDYSNEDGPYEIDLQVVESADEIELFDDAESFERLGWNPSALSAESSLPSVGALSLSESITVAEHQALQVELDQVEHALLKALKAHDDSSAAFSEERRTLEARNQELVTAQLDWERERAELLAAQAELLSQRQELEQQREIQDATFTQLSQLIADLKEEKERIAAELERNLVQRLDAEDRVAGVERDQEEVSRSSQRLKQYVADMGQQLAMREDDLKQYELDHEELRVTLERSRKDHQSDVEVLQGSLTMARTLLTAARSNMAKVVAYVSTLEERLHLTSIDAQSFSDALMNLAGQVVKPALLPEPPDLEVLSALAIPELVLRDSLEEQNDEMMVVSIEDIVSVEADISTDALEVSSEPMLPPAASDVAVGLPALPDIVEEGER